jgi:plasmid maintenance system killer protein
VVLIVLEQKEKRERGRDFAAVPENRFDSLQPTTYPLYSISIKPARSLCSEVKKTRDYVFLQGMISDSRAIPKAVTKIRLANSFL